MDSTVQHFRAAYARLFEVASFTADSLKPRTAFKSEAVQLAELNGVLLSLAGTDTYNPAAGDLEQTAADAHAGLLAGLSSVVTILREMPPKELVKERHKLLAKGVQDAAVPVIRPSLDFPAFEALRVVKCSGRPDAIAGTWDSFHKAHPACAFITPADLAAVPDVGACLILTEDLTEDGQPRKDYFDLAAVLSLTRAWHKTMERHLAVTAEQAAFRDAQFREDLEEEKRRSPQHQLERKVAELEAELAAHRAERGQLIGTQP